MCAGDRDADVSDTKSPDSMFEGHGHAGESLGSFSGDAVHF
jgi:hypothetical protein